jgi:hypothetical protein
LNDELHPFIFYPASEQIAEVGCLIFVYTLTEGTEQTKEAKRSPLSPDFPFWMGFKKNPGITAIRSCSVTAVV